MNEPHPERAALQPSAGTFDFREGPPFAVSYLSTYYEQPPTADETTIWEFLRRDFEHSRPSGRFLELGCGPTVHHVLPFVPHVDVVHMADYLEENLEQVELWKNGDARAHDWAPYAELTLAFESAEVTPESVERRLRLAREKVERLFVVDLKADTPAERRAQYDAVGCFYCAEEIGIDVAEWRKVVARAVDHLRPSGTFYMSALAGMDSYEVRDASGAIVDYPCANIGEREIIECLEELGFPRAKQRLSSSEIEHPDCGLTGVVVVAASR